MVHIILILHAIYQVMMAVAQKVNHSGDHMSWTMGEGPPFASIEAKSQISLQIFSL